MKIDPNINKTSLRIQKHHDVIMQTTEQISYDFTSWPRIWKYFIDSDKTGLILCQFFFSANSVDWLCWVGSPCYFLNILFCELSSPQHLNTPLNVVHFYCQSLTIWAAKWLNRNVRALQSINNIDLFRECRWRERKPAMYRVTTCFTSCTYQNSCNTAMD